CFVRLKLLLGGPTVSSDPWWSCDYRRSQHVTLYQPPISALSPAAWSKKHPVYRVQELETQLVSLTSTYITGPHWTAAEEELNTDFQTFSGPGRRSRRVRSVQLLTPTDSQCDVASEGSASPGEHPARQAAASLTLPTHISVNCHVWEDVLYACAVYSVAPVGPHLATPEVGNTEAKMVSDNVGRSLLCLCDLF
ncbi:hypothetical protein FQN60_009905, partial [Etheostoma spectabile]